VFAADGALINVARCNVTTTYPHPGWAEQDATALSASLQNILAQTQQALGARWRQMRSAGLATQRSNIVCWDRHDGTALSPAISWQDRRGQSWLENLGLGIDSLRERTGLYVSPHYGASKLRWCLDHLPEVQQAARTGHLACGPLASDLVSQLCHGHPVLIDPANAARTQLWNLAARDWDTELLSMFGVGAELLPQSVSTCYDFGTLRNSESAIPLRILTGDQSAALYANGRPRSDTLYINLGTGAFLQRPLRAYRQPPDGILASIVYADMSRADYVFEATVNGAGCALDWVRDQLGIPDIETKLETWLTREVDIPLFLNGIAGLGSPWWRAQFASRFIGTGEPWAQAVAVVESILFLIAENLQRLQEDEPLQHIQLSGGLAQLDGLCQRLADITGLRILRNRQIEATARGVAWLLADAEGLGWADAASDVFTPQSNPGCRMRLARWREEMHKALAAD
jgi:glycerol kinase